MSPAAKAATAEDKKRGNVRKQGQEEGGNKHGGTQQEEGGEKKKYGPHFRGRKKGRVCEDMVFRGFLLFAELGGRDFL